MTSVEEAQELARTMVDIGQDAGRQTVAIISDMNQPLGYAVGNALEVKEAIATLQGKGPHDFWLHCQKIASYMLLLSGKADSLEAAEAMAAKARDDGRALQKFRDMVRAQGGDVAQVDDPGLLPQARFAEEIIAPYSGTVAAMDTAELGWSCVRLGGGRLVKSDIIDHAVGFVLPVKVGDRVEKGDSMGIIHANDQDKLSQAGQEILAAVTLSDEAVERLPHFYGVVE